MWIWAFCTFVWIWGTVDFCLQRRKHKKMLVLFNEMRERQNEEWLEQIRTNPALARLIVMHNLSEDGIRHNVTFDFFAACQTLKDYRKSKTEKVNWKKEGF
ncbi:unnamed protein product [marine sediment metagenome]|uniref:Uncharacterized protein n=1 Tax=marine sediment metagenome TaxID=412755 RepID=X0TGY6_9ZZZZ